MRRNKFKKLAGWAMAIALCLVTAGCSNSAVPAPSNAAADTQITVTDLAGETYTFDKPLDTVIINGSGTGGPLMIMSALFGKDVCKHIAGMDNGLREWRMDMFEQYIKTVPELADVLVVGTVGAADFNLEAAMASGADAAVLPIGQRVGAMESVQPKLEAAGIPVLYIDYHSNTIENHTKSTQLIGALFGKEERAQEVIDFYNSHVTPLYEKAAEILKTEERPTVYIEYAVGAPDVYSNTYPNSFMWGSILYNLGAYCIANDVLPEGTTGKVDAEFVLSANPDKIIFTGAYWPQEPQSIRMGFGANEKDTRVLLEGYLARPGYSELNAVKNGEVYLMHHAVIREPYDCASIEACAKYIFPEHFADLDPTATLREYYETFLPYEFDGLWYLKY